MTGMNENVYSLKFVTFINENKTGHVLIIKIKCTRSVMVLGHTTKVLYAEKTC